MRSGLRLEWYFLWCEKVGHAFSSCRLHQFDHPVEVTNSWLTQEGMMSMMPFAFTHCSTREHILEPILSEPHA